MQADSTLPLEQRRHYKNAFHALSRITKDEGVLALWRGAGPTVVRAMALNMGMLASYDQAAESLKSQGLSEISTVLGESSSSAGAFSSQGVYANAGVDRLDLDLEMFLLFVCWFLARWSEERTYMISRMWRLAQWQNWFSLFWSTTWRLVVCGESSGSLRVRQSLYCGASTCR